jgi:hypothetical protein
MPAETLPPKSIAAQSVLLLLEAVEVLPLVKPAPT